MHDAPILVTGADGFVGSHLIERLQSQGYTNIFGTQYRSGGYLEQLLDESHRITIDLTKSEAVFSCLRDLQPKWIFHLASLAFVGDSFEQAERVMTTNVQIQYGMLEGIRTCVPQARMLSIGSATCYGALPPEYDSSNITEDFPYYPTSPYAVSKLSQEFLARSYFLSYDLDIVQVRPFNQIGPRQTPDFVVPALASQVVAVEHGQQPSVKVGNLGAIRDFTDVRDAVRAYELLLREGERGGVYNVGSARGVSIEHIMNTLKTLATQDVIVEVDSDRFRPGDDTKFIANIDKLRALGWEPTIELADTLRDVLNYERTRGVL